MKKIEVYVTETRWHKVEMELEDDYAEALTKDLDGAIGDDYAGDLTDGRRTFVDGEYELDYYNVYDVE